MRLLHRYVDIQKDFFIDLSKKFKENKIEISSCDLERLKTYIRIPTESNRVAFVNILEKYIFTYNNRMLYCLCFCCDAKQRNYKY